MKRAKKDFINVEIDKLSFSQFKDPNQQYTEQFTSLN